MGRVRSWNPMADLPGFLQRWNFIERAKLERELWDAFEQGEDLDALVGDCRQAVAAGAKERAFQLEVWQTSLERIRKIEGIMKGKQAPPAPTDD